LTPISVITRFIRVIHSIVFFNAKSAKVATKPSSIFKTLGVKKIYFRFRASAGVYAMGVYVLWIPAFAGMTIREVLA
jgi:hypothetical protein